MSYFSNILFSVLLLVGIGIFVENIKKLRRNILLGRALRIKDNRKQRLKNMLRVALGQSKMTKRPISGFLHILVYVAFVLMNIEFLEIVLDGLLGTHRLFGFMGRFYTIVIGTFEVLAGLVLIAVTIFWLRRNVLKINRFRSEEMRGWAEKDANYILYFEMGLMVLFLLMNASDISFQKNAQGNLISQYIYLWFEGLPQGVLFLIERIAWWLHITGILIFLNYLYYSKHLHIFLAFPNTYYAKLTPQGTFENNSIVTQEVKAILGVGQETSSSEQDVRFGANDVTDLTWLQLMNAYTCTECGRCTQVCPASQSGKKLSPRNIMMKTRDRLESLSRKLKFSNAPSSETLLNDYITQEELWACTTCSACIEACPLSIDPLSIIMDMRQYLVMEQTKVPQKLQTMMNNIENNAAPWQYNRQDRVNWIKE